VTAVPAACVVIENAVAVDFAEAVLDRYGSDDMKSIIRNFNNDPALKEFDWRRNEF
jgi:chorismate synthase